MNSYLFHGRLTAIVFSIAVLSFASGVKAANYSNAVTALNPVAYYRLNETAIVPGNVASNLGTAGAIGHGYYVGDDASRVMHPATGLLAGSADTAATFAAADPPQVIQVPFNASINPRVFSAEAWISPSVDPAGLTCPISYGHLANATGSGRSGWLLYQDNATSGAGGWNFRMYNNVGLNRSITLAGGAVPAVGSANHVVITFDGTTARLYVNGEQAGSGPAADYVPSVDGNFSIGGRDDLAFRYNGTVDEVAIYTNVLSAADILAHYDNGTNAARSVSYESLVQQQNPLLYYRLNEPAWVDPAPYPTTANLGSWGSSADGAFNPGLAVGQPGVPYDGFSANNRGPGFNGLQGVVSIPGQPLNTDTLTITAWVKRTGPTEPGSSQGGGQNGWAGIVYQRGVAGGGDAKATGLQFGPAGTSGNGILRYNWNDDAAAYDFNSGLNLPDGVWSFVAGVFTPTQTVLCVNGFLATNVHDQVVHDFSTDPILIGIDPAPNTVRLTYGGIDEVAIFDKALTVDELQQLFAAGAMPPIITSQPKAPTGIIYEGFNISLSVAAVGGQPLSYKWTRNGSDIGGQTSQTLTLNNIQASASGNYAAIVTNPNGSVTSSVVNLTIVAGPPILTSVPASTSVFPGGTAKFSSSAVGSAPITFQWYAGSTPIPGATSSTLVIPQVQASDAGPYSVLATNPNGQTNSPPATLTILPTTPNYVSAILTRGPIAYWRLNETNGSTAYDSVGSLNGSYNTLTTHNNSPGPKPTAYEGLEASNTSYSFDGNTSDIKAPALNINNNSMTIVLFMQPHGLPPTDFAGLVFTRGTGSDISGLNTRPQGNLGYHWNADAMSFNWDSTLLPVNDQWNFVALVVEPTQATIYLDPGTGMQTAVNAISHGPAAWAAETHMGTDPSGNRIYGGLMDEVAVYNYALTPADIQSIRDTAVLGTFTPGPPQVVLNPVSQTALVGDSITLLSAASGTQPLTFQWTKNDAPVPGAIRSTLSFPSSAQSDSGAYRFLVTQGNTTVTSTPAILNVLPIPSTVNLTNGLVLHLKFDDNFLDTSGRNNNGTGVGNPTFVTGKIGPKGLHYSTTVSGGTVTQARYVTLGAPPDLQFGPDQDFSVAYWVKLPANLTPGDLPFISNNDFSYGGQGYNFAPSYNQGGWSWYINDMNAATFAGIGLYSPVNTINDGAWHHLAHTFDRSDNATTYLDGVKVDARSIASGAAWNLSTGLSTDIGQANGNYAEAAEADIDDVGMWTTLLTPVEARSIYYAGQSGNSFDTTAPTSVTISINTTGGNLQIQWPTGTLQSSDQLNGGFENVPGASAPSYTVPLPNTGNRFYRVKL